MWFKIEIFFVIDVCKILSAVIKLRTNLRKKLKKSYLKQRLSVAGYSKGSTLLLSTAEWSRMKVGGTTQPLI